MRIAGNAVYTSGYSPSGQQATADARVEQRRSEDLQRNVANEEQKRKDLQASGAIVSSVSRDESLGYRRVSATNGADKEYALYADDDRELANNQKKALQTYNETQNFSRVDANIEYLGSVDIFV